MCLSSNCLVAKFYREKIGLHFATVFDLIDIISALVFNLSAVIAQKRLCVTANMIQHGFDRNKLKKNECQ